MLETLLGLIHLILFIWAVINIWGSRAALVAKLIWSAVVFVFPLVGLIVWFFIGPKKG
jgi:hypothetical protein